MPFVQPGALILEILLGNIIEVEVWQAKELKNKNKKKPFFQLVQLMFHRTHFRKSWFKTNGSTAKMFQFTNFSNFYLT